MNNSKAPKIPKLLMLPFSIFSWALFMALTLISFILGLVLLVPVSLIFSPKTRYWTHQVAVLWGKLIVFTNLAWKARVRGLENVEKGKAYVIVANHQSIMDIMACLSTLNLPFKFLAKRELFKIPCVGWHMSLSGYIPLDRSSRESGKQALLQAKAWIEKGVSVLFYPEGTRSLDGEIKNFKMGAFKLAAELGVEILPIVIDGTAKAIPKHSWIFEDCSTFEVSVGKPVSLPKDNSVLLAKKKEEIRQEMVRRLDGIREG